MPSGSVAVQTESPETHSAEANVAPLTEQQAVFRPYPGSEQEGLEESEKPGTSVSLATADESDKPDADATDKNIVVKQVNAPQEAQETLTTPRMAPSLRRRGVGKKRGFFKRLFGIR